MSEDQLKAFLEKTIGNSTLQDKLKAATDAESVAAIAKDEGYSVSAADITWTQPDSGPSEKELERVVAAGGSQTLGCQYCGWRGDEVISVEYTGANWRDDGQCRPRS